MRLLFFVSHPGHIRNFESTIRALAERSHEVHLAFDRRKVTLEAQEAPVVALAHDHANVTFGDTPKRRETQSVQAAPGASDRS